MTTVVVADDDPAIRKIVRDRLVAAGHVVEQAADGVEALAAVEHLSPELLLLDLQMPVTDGFAVLETLRERLDAPIVIVITAHGSIEAAVRAMRAGAWDFLPKPFDAAHLEHVVGKAIETRRMRRDVGRLRGEIEEKHRLVAGESSAMRAVLDVARKAAVSEATVLLVGESGTGKEVVARVIHHASRHAQGPFVGVNCAALPAELVESELFGHEKGAFTGATRHREGRIEASADGTLFLDEIAELGPGLQAKLLRVLQEREYERVGGSRTIRVEARIVAATNRDLAREVAKGAFRQDLYYRLEVVRIRLPPLRDRRDDILPLAEHFLRRHARDAGRSAPTLEADARRLLVEHSWPGNVRELANVMERCVVLGTGEAIGSHDLPEELRERARPTAVADAAGGAGYHELVADAKRGILRDALDAEGGHQTGPPAAWD